MLAKIKNIRFVNVFWLFFYLLILSLLLKNGFSSLDPDFGWHLKVGQEIAWSGEVPRANNYNFTYQGNWVDHEWLANWGIYQIYQARGYSFLVLIFGVIALFTFWLLNWYAQKRINNQGCYLVAASLQFLGITASLPHLGVRVQELALLFILTILILLMLYEQKKNRLFLFFLIPLMFLWANIHASFLIGFVLLFAWAGVKVLELILSKSRFHWLVNQPTRFNWREIMVFLGVAGGALVATGLTPYRFELYSFLSGYKHKAYLSLIQEWLPQYTFPFHYDQVIFLALGAIALFIYLYSRLSKKRFLDWWQIFLVVLFLFLAIKSRRHFPLFFIVAFPLLLKVYSPLFFIFKEQLVKWLKLILLFCLFLAAITPFFTFKAINNPFTSFCQEYPCGAVSFLRTQPEYLEKRILNNYGWGGFLIFVLPEQKLFIDGRLPQVVFAEKTFIEEYFSFFQDEKLIAQQLSKYEIELVVTNSQDRITKLKLIDRLLLMTKAKELKSKNRLRDYLSSRTEWQEVYDDGVAKVYVLRK